MAIEFMEQSYCFISNMDSFRKCGKCTNIGKKIKIIQTPKPNDNHGNYFGVNILLRKEYFNKETASIPGMANCTPFVKVRNIQTYKNVYEFI